MSGLKMTRMRYRSVGETGWVTRVVSSPVILRLDSKMVSQKKNYRHFGGEGRGLTRNAQTLEVVSKDT